MTNAVVVFYKGCIPFLMPMNNNRAVNNKTP